MDNNITIYSTYTTSASLSIEVFTSNKVFIVIAIISALIGLWNALVYLSQEKVLKFSFYSIDKIFKSVFISGVSTPTLYSIFVLIGDQYLEKILGIEIDSVQNHTIFLIACLGLSLTFSRLIWFKIFNKIKGEKND